MTPAPSQPTPSDRLPERGEFAAVAALLEQLLEQVARRVASELAAEMDPADASSPWMALETAASYLDWPKQRLYKLTASGEIPHYKHEARLLFHREELDRWLASFAQDERRSLSRPRSI